MTVYAGSEVMLQNVFTSCHILWCVCVCVCVCVFPHINFGIKWWMFMKPIVPLKAIHFSYF